MSRYSLLITATVFDDTVRLASSIHATGGGFGPIQQSEAPKDWPRLLAVAALMDEVRISVIRRIGPRASSHCAGHSLT